MMIDEQTREVARSRIRQFSAALALAEKHGHPVSDDLLESLYAGIERSYLEDAPRGRLLAGSDLVMHAEGPGAAQSAPWLSALNWLSGTAERTLKTLASNWFDLKNADGRALVKHLDLRLSGMAPGSIWLGFRIEPPAGDLIPRDEALIGELAARLGALPEAAGFVGDEGIDAGLNEALPDPAERDVMLDTLRRLSPTGRAGIHTLEIGARHSGFARLSQRERVVINEAMRHPTNHNMRHGRFVGHVREVDLDKTRLHLRGVADIGAIRCVLPEMTKETIRAIIGETVAISGRYATDRAGQPRLLYVERIEPVAVQMPPG
jgi:hypothetical protein